MDVNEALIVIIIKDPRTIPPVTSIVPDFDNHGSILGLNPAMRKCSVLCLEMPASLPVYGLNGCCLLSTVPPAVLEVDGSKGADDL